MKFIVVIFFVISVHSVLGINDFYRKNTPKKITETDTFKYYTKKNQAITIPVMVHLDKALAPNLSKEYKTKARKKAKKMFRNIFKDVENLFRRPSLNQTVQFTLLDVKFLKNATKKFVMDENVSEYLRSYCRWQGEKKIEKKEWYFSVLFTGMDLFYYGSNNTRVQNSAARGYLKGICSMKSSCSILEWRKSNAAFKLAHEIGHSLGLSHDGLPHNECRGHYIMSAKYRSTPANTWSACSRRDLHQFLSSKYASCLRPGSRNWII